MKTFKIKGKVSCIVTDNGANIKKAVKSLQQDYQEKENARRVARKAALKSKKEQLSADKTMAAVQQKGNPAKKAKTLSKTKSSSLDGIMRFSFVRFSHVLI